ncbi:MAG: amidohydrolase family protein [Flavobacteriales bacterium]|nr:amidohydrolase family protein [Flavobacteriales bacterium]
MRNLLTILCLLPSALFGQVADYVLYNGKIYTSNAEQEFEEALAIDDGILVYVGDNDGVQSFIGDNTLSVDLEGKLILPGMHDVHNHLLEGSSGAGSNCTLSSFALSTTQLGQQLSDCDPQANSNGWIFAYGFSILTLLESDENPREVLDSFFPSTPVVAMEETSHSAWVNSAAFEALSIDENTPDPEGGLIVKEDGIPNGILLDAAGDLAFGAALASNDLVDGQNYDGLVYFGLPALAEQGITSIVEGRTYWKRNYIDVWQQVKADGELTARVVLAPWIYAEDADEEQIPLLPNMYNEGDDMLRVTQIKCYIDGISLNGTAALDQDYVYNFGWPFTNGTNYIDPDRLADYITQLELVGYDFFIHSIGNRGSAESLDAIEAARNTNGDIGARHRLTHIEFMNEEEYSRFAELDVIADAQVSANWTQPNQWQWNADFVGDEIAETFIPIGSIYDANGRVTLSSDWDVSTMNPFRSIQNAVTRAPENLPTVEEAVDARTIHSAFVMRHEDVTGSIEVGKYADIICVDQDIFDIPVNQIAQTNVTMTMLGGEVVFNDGSFPVGIDEITVVRTKRWINPSITRDYVTIQIPAHVNGLVSATVLNSSGAQVESIKVNSLNQQIDVTSWAEGMYTVVLYSENGNVITKEKVIVVR